MVQFFGCEGWLGGGPYLGKIPILTNIFQMAWNHQPAGLTHSFPRNGETLRICRRRVDAGSGETESNTLCWLGLGYRKSWETIFL